MYTETFIHALNKDIQEFPEIFPILPGMNNTRHGVHRMVMLDRYSQKDLQLKTLKEGDLVILTIKEDPKFPSQGTGFVEKLDFSTETAIIRPEAEYLPIVEEKDLDEDGCVARPLNKIDKPLELFYEQIAKRNASGLSSVETPELKPAVKEDFYNVLSEERLVPAGRVLYGAGTDSNVTYFNCYVMPYPADSRGGISNHREETMEIMSRGGGVGTNGSTLRPRNALARGVNGKSSGSVSWLDDISRLTKLVSQGGSRRGAQMIMMADWHPDIVEFILSKMQNPKILRYIIQEIDNPLIREMATAKLQFEPLSKTDKEMFDLVLLHNVSAELKKTAEQKLKDGGTYSVNDPEFMSGANISVALTKEFMAAVENEEDYPLRFPDVERYSNEEMKVYNEEWQKVGDVREWERLGHAVRTYRTIKATDLWKLINICATHSAEPGIFFIDNANEKTNAAAYGQKVVATNPCGEQPLAPYSVCNLAAVNLSKMSSFETRTLDKEALQKTVRTAIRLQDNVIDATPYFLDKNKQQALGERRIGLGVMGLEDLLIKMGVRYGSADGLRVTDEIFETIALTAYDESIELAKEKGSFPFLIGKNDEETARLREAFVNSGYMKDMPESIRQGVLLHGIRNSHTLTVAPTGSTGTMIGCSTGLEPYYAFTYYRSGRLGENIVVNAEIVEEYFEAFPEQREKELPDYFVSSMDMTPAEHVDMQCVIQRWVDSSLSKTVNAPRGFTVEQVQGVYESLHAGGAKGGTVYVDGSRDSQVLTLKEDAELSVEEGSEKKAFGTDVGDICLICREGELVDSAGCATCNKCGSQLKCGL